MATPLRNPPTSAGHAMRSLRRALAAAVVAAAVAGMVACGGGGGTDADPSPVATPQQRGLALYGSTGADCVQCHADATTMRRGAADAEALAALIGAAIRDNKGRMGDPEVGLTALSAQDLLDLARYIVAVAPPGGGTPAPDPAPAAGPAVQCVPSGPPSAVRTARFTAGLSGPWAFAFLPDRRVIVTQKGGTVVIVSADGATRTTLSWDAPAPSIVDAGQGGLLDVALDPDFATAPWVYFTYQEPDAANPSQAGTAVGRARLDGARLTGFQRLYQQQPKTARGGVHFGSRIAFRADGTMFVTLGDRGQDDPANPTASNAQNPARGFGKVVRIARDGSIPPDNPAFPAGAVPGLWSLGHRNPQGAAVDPASGDLWVTEHGPQGGDELNRVAAGANHGWPLRSYGCPYGSPIGEACRVGGGVHAPIGGVEFAEPVTYWAPTSVAPSNVVVYDGAGFPEWRGQLFIGSLAGQRLWRVVVSGGRFASCEAMLGALNKRIRDVRQGPDGWLYVATDDGEIHRVER